MKRIWVLPFIFSSLFGCSSPEDKPVQKTDAISLEEKIDKFTRNYSEHYAVQSHQDDFLRSLDSSNHESEKKILLKRKSTFKNHYDQAVYQRLFLFCYKYRNVSEYTSAMNSLFDCFPNDCAKISLNKNQKSLKITPSIFVFNDRAKEVIVLKISCENENSDWADIKNVFRSVFTSSRTNTLTAGCGGPLLWN